MKFIIHLECFGNMFCIFSITKVPYASLMLYQKLFITGTTCLLPSLNELLVVFLKCMNSL